eukprot:SAG22_NODE_13463_length_405_cov_2.199346_1_plen_56_part_01
MSNVAVLSISCSVCKVRRFLPTHTLETLGVVGVSICNFLTVSIRIFWGLGYNPPNS